MKMRRLILWLFRIVIWRYKIEFVIGEPTCHFPYNWSGRWFQGGTRQHMNLNSTTFETKGNCVESSGDKFILEDRSEKCFRCVVITEKHINVLQYKETNSCHNWRRKLDEMCEDIQGDAPLISMFRVDAKPIPCPFRDHTNKVEPPFTFTYSRGSLECKSPTSWVDACTEDSRLLLKFQACPDVPSSESTTVELVCLANWKDGSSRYLVGRLEHKNDAKYQCFNWAMSYIKEQNMTTYELAQSGDETCTGIPTPHDGSTTFKLTKVSEGSHHHRSGAGCRFPSWITDYHEWHTLNHSRSFHFSSHNNATFRVTSRQTDHSDSNHAKTEMRAVCHSAESTSSSQAIFVAHVLTGCESGYMCMVFYKRVGHVIELQQSSTRTQTPEEACQNFNPQILPFTTLVTSAPKSLQCPYLGRYVVSGGLESRAAASSKHGLPPENICDTSNTQTLAVGCGAPDTMEFQLECNSQPVSAYSCHGHWADNNASYLIALPLSRKSAGARRYCFVIYNTAEGGGAPNLQVTSVTETCHRNIITNNYSNNSWAFNITPHGQCSDSGSSNSMSAIVSHILWITLNLIITKLACR